ncbi:MAG: hypothetical protein JWN30_1639 [Bacilli bacterium]|nr:hypothetical protein [Bacilli bacterium]
MSKREWLLSMQVAFTYVGTVVGAGFASGQEILKFFTRFSPYSSVSIVLSSILIGFLGHYLFSLGASYQARSYLDVTRQLFGRRYARLFDWVMTFMLFGVTVAMIAGVGALASEQIGISFDLGALLTIAITCAVLYKGMKGLLIVNSFIVPFMMSVIGLIFIRHFGSLSKLLQFGSQGLFPNLSEVNLHDPTIWGAAGSAISYAAFNLGLSVVVLVPIGGEIQNRTILKAGAWISASCLCLLLLCADWLMRLHLPGLFYFEIPMGQLSRELGSLFQYVFFAALWAEIFTTLLGNVFGLVRQLPIAAGMKREKVELLAAAVILLLAYGASHIGFSKIVEHVYPVFGVISFLLLFLLLCPAIVRKEPY